MRRLLNWLPSRRRRMESDLERELQYHLERRTTELQKEGVTEVQARRQAALEFGGLAQVQEEVRDTWLSRHLDHLQRDIQYALRTLRRSPGFAATAILSLALGIGANTAIFSILNALVLRSLPVADPQQLYVITRNESVSAPWPWFVELRDHATSLQGVVAFRSTHLRLSTDRGTERIKAALVSGTYFDVLGVQPFIGTAIGKEDDEKPGSGGWRGPVAVLSHAAWISRFGGDRSIVGRRVILNNHPFTISGVAAAGFEGTEIGESPEVFVAMAMQPVVMPGMGTALTQPRSNWLRIMGRTRPGTDLRAVEAELTVLVRRYNEAAVSSPEVAKLGEAWKKRQLEQRVYLRPGNAGISPLRQQYAQPLWVLAAVMGLVLLIACANVASLLLSRATARRKEIAVRLGLGAGRGRLVSQLLTESLLLAVGGGALGLLLARALRDVLVSYLPVDLSLTAPLDSNALAFTLVLAVLCALLFGLAPAFQASKMNVAPTLKGEEMTAGAMRLFFRKGLVVFQLSLSFLLLIGAGLFLRSLHQLTSIDPGFTRDNILVASVDTDWKANATLLQELRQLPGVVSVGLADSPPLGTNTGWNIHVQGYVPKPVEPSSSPWVGFISPGYFETMNMPLLTGRAFDDRDVSGKRDVMIVNETFARHYFAGENPVGRRLGQINGEFNFEIVGVVKDSKYTGLRENAIRMMYVPSRPGPWGAAVVHLRTAGNPAGLERALREKVHSIDKAAPVYNVHTVRDAVDRSLLRERLMGTITALFGSLALLLAVVGLYGVVSYGVARRTREFGIRIAVGARAGTIVSLVLKEAVWLLALGTLVGLGAAWFLGKLISSMLFGVQATDPVSAAIAVAVLAAAALTGAWIPARRAAKVDPTTALRTQ